MNDTKIKKRLEEIAKEMKKPGADREKLSAEIDRLLGTKLVSEDKKYLGSGLRQRGRR